MGKIIWFGCIIIFDRKQLVIIQNKMSIHCQEPVPGTVPGMTTINSSEIFLVITGTVEYLVYQVPGTRIPIYIPYTRYLLLNRWCALGAERAN